MNQFKTSIKIFGNAPEYSLLQPLGLETLGKEYKEFCLKTPTTPLVPYDEIKHIIKSGTITPALQNIIDDSIHVTINQVFPKYFTSYKNSHMSGSIYIGVNDDGIVTGIPSTSLTTQYVKKCLDDACTRIMACKNAIMSSITFQVIPLKVGPTIQSSPIYRKGTDVANTITKYEQDKTNIDTTFRQYKLDHQAWMKKKSRYNCKLTTVMNDPSTRRELIAFIQKHLKEGKVPEHDAANVYKIIKQLDTMDYIDVPGGPQLVPYKDPSRPRRDNVYFWLLKYQNHNLDLLQAVKPRKPPVKRLYHPWVSLVCLRHMIPSFTRSNVKYFMIKINVKHNNKEGNHGVQNSLSTTMYSSALFNKPLVFQESKKRKKNISFNRYICKKRVLSKVNGEPSCVDIDIMN